LPESKDIQGPKYVYRRVPESYRDKKTGGLKPGVFKVRKGRKLSVFDPTLSLPRDVLQNGIDVAKRMAASDDPDEKEQGDRQLRKYGATVEEWVANGCTVAAIAVSELTIRDLMLEELEPDGHRNVSGEDFDLFMDELAEAAVILPNEECLTTKRSDLKNPFQPASDSV
jgi:hypothetical protein